MSFRELETVVMTSDLPTHGLKRGDAGTVVQVYTAQAVEVEFVTAAGSTRSVVTLGTDKVRPVDRNDLLTVRQPDVA